MRPYKNRKDVQAKPYHSDRFLVQPELPKLAIDSDEVFLKDFESFKANFEVLDSYIQLEQMVICINASDNVKAIEFLRDELDYDILTELSAVDWLASKNKLEVFYQMLSLDKRKRIRIKCFLDKGEKLHTVENLFKSANFAEREMYDMFGIFIEGHSFLRRVIMPEDWVGHPLLKTYPLEGDEAASWYEVDKIFGKEARDIIGPENRDPALVDRYDTTRFSRLGKEVPYGADISEGEPDTDIQYQEDDGVFLIRKMNPKDSKVLDERK